MILALGVQNLHHREISVIGDVKYATAVLRCNTTLFSYITSPIAVQYGGRLGVASLADCILDISLDWIEGDDAQLLDSPEASLNSIYATEFRK